MKRSGVGAVLGLFWLALAAAAPAGATSLVVIASDTPEIEAGQVISAADSVEVPAGSHVTMVAESGRTITLDGPFSGVPDSGGDGDDGSLVSSLSALLSSSNGGALSLGTMRSGPTWVPDDPWTVAVESSGTHCLIPGRSVTLWRKDGATMPARIMITDAASAHKAEFPWPAGENQLSWPVDLPLGDGQAYFVRREGRPSARRIVMRLLPPELATDAHRVVWLADNGCRKQARHLLSTLK